VSGLLIAAVPEAIGIDGGMEGYFGAGLVSAAAASDADLLREMIGFTAAPDGAGG
jgi:hypothetical protein